MSGSFSCRRLGAGSTIGRSRWLAAFTILAPAALTTRASEAQLRWDAGMSAGVTKRWLSGGNEAELGPNLGLTAHVALLPLIRAGVYAVGDVSPASGTSARRLVAAGLRVKLLSPWHAGPVRPYLYLGGGYVGVYSPSFPLTLFVAPGATGSVAPSGTLPGTVSKKAISANAAGAGGAFGEVPVGIGASYRLRKPWELTCELGARFGLAFGGSNYRGRDAVATNGGGPLPALLPLGKDTVALALTLGITFDR